MRPTGYPLLFVIRTCSLSSRSRVFLLESAVLLHSVTVSSPRLEIVTCCIEPRQRVHITEIQSRSLAHAVLFVLILSQATDETYDLMVGVVYKRGVEGLHEFIFTPPLILQNLLTLPCQVRIRKAGSQKGFETEALESEEELPLMVVSPEDTFHFEIMLPFMRYGGISSSDYCDANFELSHWSKPVTIGPSSQAPSLACVDASNNYTLVVQAELTSSRLLLYVPYWIYDMTSLPGGDCLSVSADKVRGHRTV